LEWLLTKTISNQEWDEDVKEGYNYVLQLPVQANTNNKSEQCFQIINNQVISEIIKSFPEHSNLLSNQFHFYYTYEDIERAEVLLSNNKTLDSLRPLFMGEAIGERRCCVNSPVDLQLMHPLVE
jgi:hypothetical protein